MNMESSNHRITHYVEQFTEVYNGKPWYGNSIYHMLESITPANAFWQPVDGSHTIAQITSHIIYWRLPLIKRWDGNFEYKPSAKSEDNWKTNEQLKKVGWKTLRKSLDESQIHLLSLLAQQKDAILKKKYSDKITFQELINGILQHDLYHIGQIAYLKSIYHNKKK